MRPAPVAHRSVDLDGLEVFLREAGPREAPTLLLPHGYPCSSYEFRNLIPALADRWHLVAPDFPGCGYSATPTDFAYDFDGYADFLFRLTTALGVERCALWLHDLWHLHWALTDQRRRDVYTDVIAGLRENRIWFPRYQQYLRDHQPPTLSVWGPRDRYMPAGAARAYRRDLPDADLHLFDDGGHWLLETHLDAVVPLVEDFLTGIGPAAGR